MTYRLGLLTRSLGSIPIILILIASPSMADAQTLGLAETVWPPFTDMPNRPRYAVDLVHEALTRAELDSETTIVDMTALLEGLQNGSFDGSAALWRSPEREAYLLFSQPYLENRIVLVGRSGADVSATSLSQLEGRRIAVVEGYAYGDTVDAAEGPTLVSGIDLQENLQRLLREEVDYMLVDELVIRSIAQSQPVEVEEHLAIGTNPMAVRSLHFAVRRDRPDAESIVDRFNEQIVAMMLDGTYNRILHLDWIRADVDGDGRSEFILGGAQAGTEPPTNSYALFAMAAEPTAASESNQFVVDGQVYENWNAVPESNRQLDSSASETGADSSDNLLQFTF